MNRNADYAMFRAKENPFPFLVVIPAVGIIGVVSAAVVYWKMSSKVEEGKGAGSYEGCPDDRKPVDGAPGVCRKSGVLFNEAMIEFLNKIRPMLSFTPVLNDGLRTPEQQAHYMVVNWTSKGSKAEGDKYLQWLYPSVASYFIPVMPDEAKVLQVVRDLKSKGIFGISGHMIGDGLDFSLRGVDAAQKAELIDAAKKLGAGNIVDEGDHVHVGGLTLAGQMSALAEQAAGKAAQNWYYIAAAAAVGAVLIGGVIYATRE